jgi:predicted DNA-binding protein
VIAQLDESQRQVIILALVELKLRRPGWGDYLDDITDRIFTGQEMRKELERLHAELGRATSGFIRERIEALELTADNLTGAVQRLENLVGDGNG